MLPLSTESCFLGSKAPARMWWDESTDDISKAASTVAVKLSLLLLFPDLFSENGQKANSLSPFSRKEKCNPISSKGGWV